MMAAEEHLIVFKHNLAPARQCRLFGIMPVACFLASLPSDFIQGVKRRSNTLVVLPKQATQ